MTLPASLRFARFELQPHERRLLVDGQPVTLGARAFDVLIALAEKPGHLVGKNELMDVVWPHVVVEENNLQSQISTLRKILGPQVIATIPGRGYRFTARLEMAAAATAPQPAEPAPASAAASADPPAALRTNLPETLPPLLGRDDDLVALGALVDRYRLVTITGAGGMGKTRLAQALLLECRERFTHGVCFVELAATVNADALPAVIASALGIHIGASGDALPSFVAAVAPLAVLIALDNAEHLIEAVARVADALLAGAPDVRLVVTGQVPLRLAAERIYRLDALAIPDTDVSAQEALTYGAIALFVDRSQAANRRFVLDDHNAGLVVDLCRRLDGVALAIELAAARLPLLGLRELAAALDQRLRVLTAGNRTAPPRQQTLRAALEWSHGLLNDAEQRVYRRLAVFVGSALLSSVQAVAADDAETSSAGGALDAWAVVDALGGLVDRSLVAVLTDADDSDAPPRYQLLDSPRAHAHERLEAAGESAAFERRHAEAMATLFTRAEAEHWSGRIAIDAWRHALAADLGNGRAAVAWGLKHNPALALAIAPSLAWAMGRDLHREAIALWASIEPLLDDDGIAHFPPSLAGLAAERCARTWLGTRPRRAWMRARQALGLLKAPADAAARYRALCCIASSSAKLGDATATDAALAEMQALNDSHWPAVMQALGAQSRYMVAFCRGDHDAALRWANQHAAFEHQAGVTGNAMQNLADAALAAGRVDEAVRDGQALLALYAGSRHQHHLAYTQLNLAGALLTQGRVASAREIAQAGWPQAARFDLQAAWADHLALLAALEARPRAAARLAGFADAAYLAIEDERQTNELRSVSRAIDLATASLGVDAISRLRADGATQSERDVAALAFASSDAG